MKTKTGLFVLKLIFFYSVFGPEVIGGLAYTPVNNRYYNLFRMYTNIFYINI